MGILPHHSKSNERKYLAQDFICKRAFDEDEEMTDSKEEKEQLEQLEREKEAARKAVADDGKYDPADDDKTWEPGC